MRTAGDGCIGTGGGTFSRHQMALLCPWPPRVTMRRKKKEERSEKRETFLKDHLLLGCRLLSATHESRCTIIGSTSLTEPTVRAGTGFGFNASPFRPATSSAVRNSFLQDNECTLGYLHLLKLYHLPSILILCQPFVSACRVFLLSFMLHPKLRNRGHRQPGQ